MTPAALIVFGAVAYFTFRLRFVLLGIIWERTVGRAEVQAKRRREDRRRDRHDVGFYTVEQVWGDDEEEKKSA